MFVTITECRTQRQKARSLAHKIYYMNNFISRPRIFSGFAQTCKDFAIQFNTLRK